MSDLPGLYDCRERETRVPAALTGSVWSESFSLVMTRLRGEIKAREIMYGGYVAFSELNPLSKGDLVMHFHSMCLSRTGSG